MMKNTLRTLSALFLLICLVLSFVPSGAADGTHKKGDVDTDGNISADDARLALRASADLEKLYRTQWLLADVNADGDVTANDARQILRYSAGLQSVFFGSITADEDQVNAALPQIKAFFECRYYLSGRMIENNEPKTVAMAIDGDDYEVFTELDGAEISVMRKDGKTYLKRPSSKQYVAMSETLLKTIGVSPDDFNVSFARADFDSQAPDSAYDVDIGGTPGVCISYGYSGTAHADFYAVNGNLVEIIYRDDSQYYPIIIMIDYFSVNIPDDQISLNGYTKAKSLFDMLSDIMQEE